MEKTKSTKICCLLDTSAISCILSNRFVNKSSEREESEIKRLEKLNIIKEEVDYFVVSSVVIHELSLMINGSGVYKVILNYLTENFRNFRIDNLDSKSANIYNSIYKNNKILSESQNNGRYKHKLDALIVSQALFFSDINQARFSDFWLLTEDNAMRQYSYKGNMKVLKLEEAVSKIGRFC